MKTKKKLILFKFGALFLIFLWFFSGSFVFRKQAKIFCLILTHEAKLMTHAKTVHETWAKKCDNHTFILKLTSNISIYQNQVYLNGKKIGIKGINILDPGLERDNYKKLTDKIYKSFIYLTKYDENYDWYLKADDDTFIFMDNLRNFLKDKNPQENATYGLIFKKNVLKGFLTGGAGYVVSKKAMREIGKRIAENYSSCPNTGVEDVNVADCFKKLKVYPQETRDHLGRGRFHQLSIKAHFNGLFAKWFLDFSDKPPVKVSLLIKTNSNILNT